MICDEIPNNPYVIINDISLLICDDIPNNPYVIINDISLLICDEIPNNPYVIINDISLLICDQIPNNLPENKLYKIFPGLKECISCPRKNRKEETVMARLHIGHSFLTQSFLLKGEEPPMCIGCDKRLTIEHILPTFY